MMKHHDIQYFLDLQDRFSYLLKYISCHEDNFTCYSVKNESLIVDICSFFDSLCQTYIRDIHYSGQVFRDQSKIKAFQKKIEKKKNFDAGDYRKLLETEFSLSTKSVNLNLYEDHLFTNPLRYHPDNIDGYQLAPFKKWGSGRKTNWWNSFTKLKHNRALNHKEASLKNVVFSLAAVFVILSLENETEFKKGQVPPDIYDVFLPKYWDFSGRIMPGVFMWK